MATGLQGIHGLPLAHDAVEGWYLPARYLLIAPSNRAVQSKLAVPSSATVEDADVKATLKLGLFSYPVLQAADILVYRYG